MQEIKIKSFFHGEKRKRMRGIRKKRMKMRGQHNKTPTF